ncbi:DUF3284 domain-containing protein [uncultured Ligilactobacillus sp.]|uniref:DUF3284 domain-containing protein n=1 Tax=uncultured Ligilactobacillus sp. TaxID=2837633 RepID=UPI00272BA5A9|nr:DUF3284 domain-containing protein [uncultured Ligilactobacillus sp.]
MEISMNLNVSAEYLFQRLLDTLLYDIKQETGRELTVAELPDLSYATKLDHQTKAQLKVIKLIPGRSYHLQIQTDNYVKKEAYELTPLAKDQVKVDYHEESLVKKPSSKLQTKIFAPLAKWIRRHNFMKLLKEIEVGY